MRLFVAFIATSGFLMGCAASPARPSDSKSAKHDVEVIVVAPQEPPREHRTPQMDPSCPLFFPPRDVGSVVRIPATMFSLAMDPVMQTLCSCTRPGEFGTIVARINYGDGTVDVDAPESPAVEECLRDSKITFVPPPPDDVPPSDCINCGPRYYGVFVDSPPPPPKEGLRLVYSFLLDRSNEVLDCPVNTHAERGTCKTNAAAAPIAPEKPKCMCAKEDLKCAIACAAGH